MAIKTGGTLWGWGENGDGQLGNNSTDDLTSPTQIGALTTWAKVSCGDDHTVALKDDGTIWSMGDATTDGATGHGDVVKRSSPVQIGTLDVWGAIPDHTYNNSVAIGKE